MDRMPLFRLQLCYQIIDEVIQMYISGSNIKLNMIFLYKAAATHHIGHDSSFKLKQTKSAINNLTRNFTLALE
jgi:hypothetical protein